MSVLYSQYFDCGYLGPIQSTFIAFRNRVVIRNENQTLGMIQIYGQLAGSFPLREFMAPFRWAFGGPKIHKTRSGP